MPFPGEECTHTQTSPTTTFYYLPTNNSLVGVVGGLLWVGSKNILT